MNDEQVLSRRKRQAQRTRERLHRCQPCGAEYVPIPRQARIVRRPPAAFAPDSPTAVPDAGIFITEQTNTTYRLKRVPDFGRLRATETVIARRNDQMYRAVPVNCLENGVQRGEITMHIGKNGDAHDLLP